MNALQPVIRVSPSENDGIVSLDTASDIKRCDEFVHLLVLSADDDASGIGLADDRESAVSIERLRSNELPRG
jgi:hypothetical protein